MNIAIVGGGSKCLYLMNFIATHQFHVFSPKIVAVADINNDAVGMVEARKRGLFVTHDYNDFFNRDDIELIVELAGDIDVYNDILTKKKKNVRAIAHTTALLFWEISRISQKEQEARMKLHESRTIYEVMINNLIEEDTMVIKTDCTISDINDSLLNRLGLKREDAIGHFCYEITHHQNTPCDGTHHPCPLSQTLATGKTCRTTHVHLDKNGNELYYSISCYPFMENNEIKGVIEISRDITKEIKSQKTMMQQEKLMSIGRLSAGIAHEINNPLTTILTSAMLIQEDLNEKDPVYAEMEMISKEALRCRKIVQSLLDFARQTSPMKKNYDLNAIITESVFLTKKQAQFNDVTLKTELSQDLPRAFIDKDQIQQTLINLILNAVEATASGGNVALSSQYNPSNKMIVVKVTDTGCGIPKENLDKIFDPFFTTRESGTGLGLSITHSIIEQHGGRIEVDSTPGKGTTFTILLPVKSGGADAQ
jgi:two-component system, NtrC family, sensor kinase